MRRNLIYHIYPTCHPWGGDMWRWNVDQLRKSYSQFDRIVFSIALDEKTETEEEVRKHLNVKSAEFLIRANKPTWETETLIEKLAMVQSRRDDEITFYGHTKGSSREPFYWENVKAWTGAMYLFNLGNQGIIDKILHEQPDPLGARSAVGCFRTDWPNHGGSNWHFAGNFWWVKNSALFSQAWQSYEPTNLGAEGYIGRHIAKEMAVCLYKTDVDPYLTKLDEEKYRAEFQRTWGS